MANVLFDCSQFLTFNVSQDIDVKQIMFNFERMGFNILVNNEIPNKKREVIKDFCFSCVIELCDKEFLGDFEGCREGEVDSLPQKIKEFSNAIKDIHALNGLANLSIILVNYFYEKENLNLISMRKIKIYELNDALYGMSRFGESGNMLIIMIEP